MLVRVAHDYSCPWCYIGWHQARRLQSEYPVQIDWTSCELWPEGLECDECPAAPLRPGEARTPTRLELAYLASGVPKPRRPHPLEGVHNALEATEHARAAGVADEFVDRLYRACWTEGLDINDLRVLRSLGEGVLPHVGALVADVENRAYDHLILKFDDPAHEAGVYHVPTFFIGARRYAEQPYSVLARAVEARLK